MRLNSLQKEKLDSLRTYKHKGVVTVSMRDILREFVITLIFIIVIIGLYFTITLITESPTIRVISSLIMYLMVFGFVLVFIYRVASSLFAIFFALVGSIAYLIVKEEKKPNDKKR